MEERIKREVMALSARDRRRIKGVSGPASTEVAGEGDLYEARAYRDALEAVAERGLRSSEAGVIAPLSKEMEIKRRFAVPLAQESSEFPSRAEIQSRIEPICYEEGVSGGVATGSLQACAELVETAAEHFVKELLESWLSISRSNGAGLIQTKRFKRQLRKEEASEEKGDAHRNAIGLLPIEADAVTRREALGMDEIRLALQLDNGRLPQDQFLAEESLADGYLDVDMQDTMDEHSSKAVNGVVSKHDSGINGIGDRPSGPDSMAIDEADWGWQGGAVSDRQSLFDTLKGVMTANA